MDQTPLISSSRNHGMPDDREMEQVQSDLKALKGLYGLLQKGPADENQLDETSRAYLMRMLDDATQNALLKQAKMISGSLMPPALERNLSIRSDRQARAAPKPREAVNPPASPSLGLREVSERLHRLNLQHSPPSSRDGRPVHGNRHAAEEPAMLSRLPSNRSSRTAIMPPPYRPSREQPDPAAPRPLLNLRRSTLSSRHIHGHGHAAREPAVLSRLPSNRSSTMRAPQHQSSRVQGNPAAPRPRLDDPHQSTSSSRHVHSQRRAAEKPVLSRLASIHSSRNAMPPPQYHPSREHTDYSGLNLYRLPVAATSQHGTMTGRSPLAHQHRTRPIYDHQSSLERDSMRRSVSRKLSLGRERPLDHATARRVAAEGSSSTRRFRKLGSGVSVGMASRRGSERPGRCVVVPTPRRYSSSASSNEAATIRSRITPHRREITEQFPRRAAEEGKLSAPRRQRKEEDASISSVDRRPRRMLSRTNSSSTYTISSPGAARSFTYTGSTASSASASAYSSSPVNRRRGSARPVYPSESSSSDSSRSRRRRRRCIRDQERKERWEGRLRKLKEKIAMVFHHRHDHHHHHHHHQRGQVSTSTDTAMSDRHAGRNRKSAWKQLGGLFHRTKGRKEKKPASLTAASVAPKEKKAGSQTAVTVVPKKKKGGGGMSVLFGGMRHLRRKHKEAASVKKMSTMASKMKEPATVKKMSKMATKVKEPATVKKMRKMASKAPGRNKKINWWKLLRKRRGKPQHRLSL